MTTPLWTLSGRRGAAALALALTLPGLAACEDKASSGTKAQAQAAAANPCGTFAPDKTSKLPLSVGGNQTEIDCTAWQAFIALNWQADPNRHGYPNTSAAWASFGAPGDMSPKVWESYYEAAAVFDGGAALTGKWQAKRPAVKPLSRISKLGATDLTDITQAGGNHWLTNQRGEVTYYEVMMNQDEFEFITQKNFDLTTAAGQLACATQPGKVISDGGRPPTPPPTGPLRGGLNFPVGFQNGWDDTDCVGNKAFYGQHVGAIEVKAAWTPLPADGSLNYRYKTAVAEIRDPATRATRTVTVGLVGLHIIRKRFPKMPWIWSTFEHIDNSPDEAANGGATPPKLPSNPNQRPRPGYTFFNTNCIPAQDPTYGCRHNVPPPPCGAVGICSNYRKPMQITRINPVGEPANGVTAYVWSLLPAQSVYNYYRLINVQWPQAPLRTPPGPGRRTLLPMDNPAPQGAAGGSGQIVANTTLESFLQTSASCMDCHVFASIASAPGQRGPGGSRRATKTAPAGGLPPYASDYSFIFFSETKK